MAYLEYSDVGIRAIAAAVPERVFDNRSLSAYYPESDVEKIIQKTGVAERRFTDASTTSADLCEAAARRLMSEAGIEAQEIDLLVFISQTPDYRMPATSVVLQHRLGLPKGCMAFDISLGCSAWLYGLSVVYGMMQSQSGLRKALILDGETRSKVYSLRDRRTAFLFGDAGSATLVERQPGLGKSTFSFHSDGSLEGLIKIEAGGYRMPSSEETVKERVVDEYGNIRSLEQGSMDGADVFNFVLKEVPRDIRALLERTSTSVEDYDYTLLHQANDFINSYLVKKLKLDPAKVPSTVHKFGNTSSVSIPLTMVTRLGGSLDGKGRLLASAFGVGMTWASAALPYNNVRVCPLVEV